MLAGDIKTWVQAQFAQGVNPPISFLYGGKKSSELLPKWKFTKRAISLDQNRARVTFISEDPASSLQVITECMLDPEYDAAEWVCYFQNNGSKDTPLLESIQTADCAITRREPGEFILHHTLGSNAMRIDFAPDDEIIKAGEPIILAPAGGRSSDSAALPFFNLEAPSEGGVIIAVGWSGRWTTTFALESLGRIQFKTGLELTRFYLHPGERIRTPRILFMLWQGADYLLGHNRFRQLLLRRYLPQRNGQPVTLPFAFSGCRDQKPGDEANNFTEENQIDFAKHLLPYGFEIHWIDAGWFKGRWPNGVGSWFIRSDGFPRGLSPVSDYAKAHGMGFLLWFEPERVHDGTWLDCEHPEWLIQLGDNPNKLLNLGNPAALNWLITHVSRLIASEGIAIYRHDFNFDPLPYWRAADVPGREGLTEIRYIEGFYAYWDALRAAHPGLVIDNCASGGRRIDLETVSRSVPLWRTDYMYFEPNGQQCHTYGLSFYLPANATGNKDVDTYRMRSAYGNGLVVNWDPYSPDFPAEKARKLADEFRRVREFFYGDFYPLTKYEFGDDAWMAYQFHRPDLRKGIVLAFRRQQAPEISIIAKLRGLEGNARYTLEDADTGGHTTRTGNELADGLKITVSKAPGSVLLFYQFVG